MRAKGEGTIFLRSDGMWIAALPLPPKNGERRRKVMSAKTKSAVIAKLRQAKKDLERTGDLPTASMKLETWLTLWLSDVLPKRKIRPVTLEAYASQVRSQIIPIIGKTRLDQMTASTVRRLHNDMESAGLSSTYILNTHWVLSKALKDAMREGRVSRNVCEIVEPPTQEAVELEPLSVPEAISVLRAAAGALAADSYTATPVLWATYLLTASRRSELLGLEWDRIHFDDDDPHIDLSWQLQRIKDISTASAKFEYRHVDGKLYLTRPKSKSGWRIIPLVEPLRGLLWEHRKRAVGNGYGLVFTTPYGRPVEPSRASDGWAKWKHVVTTKSTRLHDLRHTTVDLLYEANVDEDLIQEIVGHSTRSMTRQYKRRGNRKRLEGGMLQLSALLESYED